MHEKIITIDGPSGAGKGTIAAKIANYFNYALLDSGALYRLLALYVVEQNIKTTNTKQICAVIKDMQISFKNGINGSIYVYLFGKDVTLKIRTEEIAKTASIISSIPCVRQNLLQKQRDFASDIGLVADGRDMGTVVFPQAKYKVFITADVTTRAVRRQKQLQHLGKKVNMPDLICQIKARDEMDKNRKHSPLLMAKDAFFIDTSHLSIDEVFDKIKNFVETK
jgi:CMP/dCMP kinase